MTAGIVLMVSAAILSAADATPVFKDDFSAGEKAGRRALRGDWKFTDGAASCVQDDELFKKLKNHGPILFYDLAHRDATVKFSFKPTDARSVVFTMNAEKGHVFRVGLSAKNMQVRAFPPDSAEKAVVIATEAMTLKNNEWTAVEVSVRGEKATIRVGDRPAIEVSHATFSRPKSNLSIGFSYGSLAVKDLTVLP